MTTTGGNASGSAYIFDFVEPSGGWNGGGEDEVAPTITGVAVASDNGTIAVTMSEAVYNTNGASGALEASDFAFSISAAVRHLYLVLLQVVYLPRGNVYTLGYRSKSGTPNGSLRRLP